MPGNCFSFNGKSYTVKAFEPQRTAAEFKTVYLDLNESWTREEFHKIMTVLEGKEVYAFDDGLVPLTGRDGDGIFKRMGKYHFGLFSPCRKLKIRRRHCWSPKSGKKGPDIKDLKGSDFGSRLDIWLGQNTKLRVFNLGTELNPYLKTLKEHRAFLYEQGDLSLLASLIKEGKFARDAETPDRVVMDNAGIAIERSVGTITTGNTPDHVMRLFAYNHLMQQLKQGLYADHEADSSLVAEAQEAYVVSPLSSLVVIRDCCRL